MEIRYRIAPLIARMHNKLLKYFGASLQLLTSLSRLRRCFCTPRVKRFSVGDSKRRDNQLHQVLGRFTHDRSVRSILHRPERDGQARLAPSIRLQPNQVCRGPRASTKIERKFHRVESHSRPAHRSVRAWLVHQFPNSLVRLGATEHKHERGLLIKAVIDCVAQKVLMRQVPAKPAA